MSNGAERRAQSRAESRRAEGARAEPSSASSPASSGPSLKRDTDALRAELELDPNLAIPAVVRKACEALCAPHDGPLLALVLRLKEQALGSLRARVGRIAKELELPPKPSLSQSIALANAHLGMAQSGPLCKQVDRLFEVVGLKL